MRIVMVEWERDLTRTLVPKGGQSLFTLSDAAELFEHRLGDEKHSGPIANASALMLRAAETGRWSDLEAATEQITLVLRDRRLL